MESPRRIGGGVSTFFNMLEGGQHDILTAKRGGKQKFDHQSGPDYPSKKGGARSKNCVNLLYLF